MNDGGYAKEIRKKEEGPSIHQTETESEGRVESSLGEGERQYHTPPGPRLASLVSLKSGEEEEEERSFFIRFIRDAQGTTTIREKDPRGGYLIEGKNTGICTYRVFSCI